MSRGRQSGSQWASPAGPSRVVGELVAVDGYEFHLAKATAQLLRVPPGPDRDPVFLAASESSVSVPTGG
jgi:hypothetical protein